jgi:hypothetical protein
VIRTSSSEWEEQGFLSRYVEVRSSPEANRVNVFVAHQAGGGGALSEG